MANDKRNDLFENCTNNCRSEPHICDCDFMTGRQVFNTKSDRERIENNYYKYPRGHPKHPFSRFPYEPWVIESWKRRLEELGGKARVDKIIERLNDIEGVYRAAQV